MYKIYVNDIQIDTYNIDNNVINALLFDLSVPSKRGAKFSNKIILPKTANNIKAFEFYDSDLFFKTYIANIYDDTIHVISGDVNVIEIKDNITIQIVGEFKQLMDSLKKPMYELDIDSDDFVYNLANYGTMLFATSGYMNWEIWDTRKNLNAGNILQTPYYELTRPCYLVLSLIEKIFEDAGYEVDTSELDSIASDLRLISNAESFWIAFYQVTHASTTLAAGLGIILPIASAGSATVDYIWDVTGANDFDIFGGVNRYVSINSGATHHIDNTRYIIEVDIDEVANLEVYFQPIPGTAVNFLHRQEIKQTGIMIYDVEHLDTGRLSFSFDVNVTINEVRVVALANEKEIYISGTTHVWADGASLAGWTRTSGVPATSAMLYNLYVKAKYNLPNWTQYEFLKEFWSMLNINVEIFGSTIKLTHNTPNDFVNITDYISERGSLKNNKDYAQRNYFMYNSLELGSYAKDYISNTIEKTLINLKSDSSIDVDNLDGAVGITAVAKTEIYSASTPTNTTEDDRLSINERFLIPKAHEIVGHATITQLLVFAEQLTWSELYDNYYADYYDYLQNSRVIKYDLKLNYNIYQQILNARKIYDNALGRELTVLKINKYNPNGLTDLIAVTREI